MKTAGVRASTAFLLTTLLGGMANAQDASFILANNTAFTVYSVHIWAADSPYSGPDRLGNATVASEDVYRFTPDDGDCMYNIRVTFAESDYEKQWGNVNLCNLSTVILNYNYLNHNVSASIQ